MVMMMMMMVRMMVIMCTGDDDAHQCHRVGRVWREVKMEGEGIFAKLAQQSLLMNTSLCNRFSSVLWMLKNR